jgi:hypothetical protein
MNRLVFCILVALLLLHVGQAVGDDSAQNRYRWKLVTAKAAFPPRDGAGALAFKGKMWLLGGWNSGDKVNFPKTCISDVWSSTDGATWTLERKAAPWEGRHTAGYAVHQDKMWVVGGDASQRHYQSDVWCSSDGRDWRQMTDRAPWGPRVLQYTIAYGDRIWVLGGQTLPPYAPAEEQFFNDVWSTADGANWTRATEHAAWSPRGMIQGDAVFKGRMWFLGGGTYDTPRQPRRNFYNEVWSSTDGVHWRQDLAKAPWAARQYHSVAVFDDQIWVLAGCNFDTPEQNRNDVWHSPDGVHWTELPHTPWPTRHAGSVFVYDNHLWMVGGSHPGSTPINDVWRLDVVDVPKGGNR